MNSTDITGQQPFYKSHQAKQLLITGITGLCIFLLIYTAQAKFAEHDRFYKGLTKVQYLKEYALTISWLVPVCELAIALLLIIPTTQRLGLRLFTIMMGVFTLYITSMLLWADKLPCHCGGAIEMLSWKQHLLFNLGFMLLAILGIYLQKNINRKFKL